MKIHIVGIEGAGTSALAELYVAAGHTVSGSDNGDGFYRAQLALLGVTLFSDFDAAHVPENVDMVVYSTAFSEENPEIAAAHARHVPVMAYPEAVAALFNATMGIAVCGTHGKTTTTALVTEALATAGRDPQAIIGSQIVGWRGNARVGNGDVMVLEADEYQNKLRFYNPWGVILTSVEYDHPDFYPTPAAYQQAFQDFVARIPQHGVLVACGDDAAVRILCGAARCRVVTYGFQADNDAVITQQNVHVSTEGIIENTATVTWRGCATVLNITIPGAHNILNATAAFVMASHLVTDATALCAGLTHFRGARRRFEQKGKWQNALLVDDYAHHPTEVRATLAAARALYPTRRVIAAFHPHTFTRTKALLEEFAQSFDDADYVVVLDIYGSARETHGGVHAQDLVAAINRYTHNKAEHVATISDLAQWARMTLCANDLFMTIGAGDIWKVHEMIKGNAENA